MTIQRRDRDPVADLLRCADGRLETALAKVDAHEEDDLSFDLMAARMLVETARLRLALGGPRRCPVCGW